MAKSIKIQIKTTKSNTYLYETLDEVQHINMLPENNYVVHC